MQKTVLMASMAFLLFTYDTLTADASVVSETQYHDKVAVEKRVREYFADTPVMIEIARCESNFRHYTDAGNLLRGGSGGGMVGLFQFFESIHKAGALSLGYDISTLEGNLAYARHIYTSQGATPWNSAKNCWDVPLPTPAPAPMTTATVEQDQTDLLNRIELLTKLVLLLQQQLALKSTPRA